MTRGSHHGRLGAVMLGAIGNTLMILGVIAVYELDTRIAGYAIGALVLACLAVCGAASWLDAKAARSTDRLVHQLRRQSNR